MAGEPRATERGARIAMRNTRPRHTPGIGRDFEGSRMTAVLHRILLRCAMRTMRTRIWLGLLTLAAAAPAVGSSTLCDFSSKHYALEFTGYGEIAMIQVHRPRGLKMGPYTVLDFDERAKRVHIVHEGTSEQGGMPPFVLRGAGRTVRIEVDGTVEDGVLGCQWELSTGQT